MRISDIIDDFRQEDGISDDVGSNHNRNVLISIEFFPPKTDAGVASLYKTAEQLMNSYPVNFVDVTWGAGGFDVCSCWIVLLLLSLLNVLLI